MDNKLCKILSDLQKSNRETQSAVDELKDLKDETNASPQVLKLVQDVKNQHEKIKQMTNANAITAIRIEILKRTADRLADEMREALEKCKISSSAASTGVFDMNLPHRNRNAHE